jgi:hypothetical protein
VQGVRKACSQGLVAGRTSILSIQVNIDSTRQYNKASVAISGTTNDTAILITGAVQLLDKIFRFGNGIR